MSTTIIITDEKKIVHHLVREAFFWPAFTEDEIACVVERAAAVNRVPRGVEPTFSAGESTGDRVFAFEWWEVTL